MKSTRLQILDILQNQAGMSARELGQALLVSTADVRYHLGALRREGLIEPLKGSVQPQDRMEGNLKRSAGRPAERYCLSVRARPNRYDRLAEALLEEILIDAPPPERKALLGRIAARMGGDGKPAGSLASRLVQAVQRLNELHYEASWEARPGHPQVKLGRCPYASILPEHPELCQLDAELLENLLGAPVVQTAKQVPDVRGARVCQFLVGKPKSL